MENIYTTKQVAKYLKVVPSVAIKIMQENGIKPIRVSARDFRWKEKDINRVIIRLQS